MTFYSVNKQCSASQNKVFTWHLYLNQHAYNQILFNYVAIEVFTFIHKILFHFCLSKVCKINGWTETQSTNVLVGKVKHFITWKLIEIFYPWFYLKPINFSNAEIQYILFGITMKKRKVFA